jgi:AraC-like DNA-binding protein
MKLYIKYMVSLRCKLKVIEELRKIGVEHVNIELGMVEIISLFSEEERLTLRKGLLRVGLELMDDKKSILIEKIKNIITDLVHYSDELPKVNFSAYLSTKLDYDYIYLANTFSDVMGTTIEHYIISHKIEKVKELLLYDELNLTEISYKLNYSSVAHLSNQFKKVTGLTPTYFKNLKQHRKRIALEDL